MKPFYVVRHTVGAKSFAERIGYLVQEQLPDVDVRLISAQRQKAMLTFLDTLLVGVLDTSYVPRIINLDPFTRLPHHVHLDICRVFNADTQERCNAYAARPGFDSIEVQLRRLTSVSSLPEFYYIIDDDISSGGTMAFVSGLISTIPTATILSQISLLDLSVRNAKLSVTPEVFDVIDSHDFLPPKQKTEQSGLVMKLNNRLQRMTYINPLVNLQTRAKLPFPQTFVNQLKAEVPVPEGWGEGRWL